MIKMSVPWVIIGGGIHGTHMAIRLIGEAGICRDDIRILDPEPSLIRRWLCFTETTSMPYLRSPSVHNLDVDPWSLQQFAGGPKDSKIGFFTAPYRRPSTDLFNKHCQKIIERLKIEETHIQDTARQIELDGNSVVIKTSNDRMITANHVVLSIGASEQLAYPQWVPQKSSNIKHIFDRSFSLPEVQSLTETVIVGGGISAGHMALKLLEAGHLVQVVCRHPLRSAQFDSAPGWLGPKYKAKFDREADFNRRRSIIKQARNPGTVTPRMHQRLTRAIKEGRLLWHHAEVKYSKASANMTTLYLSDGQKLQSKQVLLATGFASQRPGGKMLDQLIKKSNLPCAQCGYPVAPPSLQWHSRIFVTGPLAELEIGPVSRNIAGARQAANRVISAIRNM